MQTLSRYPIIPSLLVGLCGFYYLALFTYHPYDNSFFSAYAPPQAPRNQAGLVGSLVSSYGIYYFGLLSYLLPLSFVAGVLQLQRKQLIALVVTLLLSLTGLCLLAMLLRLYHPHFYLHELAFVSEGQAGAAIVRFAEELFGWWGSVILCTSILIAGLLPTSLFTAVSSRSTAAFWFPIRTFLSKLTRWPRLLWYRVQENLSRLRRPPKAALPHPAVEEVEIAPDSLADFRAKEIEPAGDSHATSSNIMESKEFSAIFPLAPNRNNGWGAEEEQRKQQLESFLSQFKISGKIVDLQRGPFVTTYAFKPDAGTKQNAIHQLAGDLALHLQVEGIFTHPLHSKGAIGLQIPNKSLAVVNFADLMQHRSFHEFTDPLPLALGVDVYGNPVYESLAHMPHLLLAGSTGSGKSVGLHSFICSLLSKNTPEELKLIFIDPKRLELTFYEGLPYLLRPIITDVGNALAALTWAIEEMEQRYKILQLAKVRSIDAFNQWWKQASSGERKRFCVTNDLSDVSVMPYLVIVIDELADLVLQSSGEMSKSITLLAQKARACGIHMILATQRPSVDVITGLIKANMPARISYRLTSSYDSRTILDQVGAEKLLGRGDMLWHKPGSGQLLRLHGAYITDGEIRQLVSLLVSRYPR